MNKQVPDYFRLKHKIMQSRMLVLFLIMICLFVPTVNADPDDIYMEILSPEDGFSYSEKLTVEFFIENRGDTTIVFSGKSHLALMIQNEDFNPLNGPAWITLVGDYEIEPGENWTISVDWYPTELWYFNDISISLGHYLDSETPQSYVTSNIPGEYGTTDSIHGTHYPSSRQLEDFEKIETRIRLLTQEINLRTVVGPDVRNPQNSASVSATLEIFDGGWNKFEESFELICSAEKGTIRPSDWEHHIYTAPDYETTDTITVSYSGTEKYAASSGTAKVNVLENIFLNSWDVDFWVRVQPVEPHFMVNVSSPKPFTVYKIVLGGIVISEERFTVGGDYSDQIIVNNMDEVFRVRGLSRVLEIWVVDAYRNPDFHRYLNSVGADGPAEWEKMEYTPRIIGDKEYRDDPIMDVWDFIIGVYTDLMNWIFG